MHIRILLLFFVFSLFHSGLQAQNAYWVFFKNKKDTQFNPYEYFDQKAIERRIKHNLPLCDSTDYPVNQYYLTSCESSSDSTIGVSRWMNGIALYCTPDQINEIQAFSFVRKVEVIDSDMQVAKKKHSLASRTEQTTQQQLDVMGVKHFKREGIDGKGVRIAIFDAGFPNVDRSHVFKHIRKDNRIIETYDFAKKDPFVYHANQHGTMVMSVIGGINYKGEAMGLATGAEFLLARTEIGLEVKKEEVYWLLAAEWADKHGADIINSSLGYTYNRYFRSDMDGQHSLVTRAANMAARKGILVVNAAGNDGDGKWKIIGAPADADSVLTVGGVRPVKHYSSSFSSYGPTADGRMKPNVCAYGTAAVEGKDGNYTIADGTSFASPLVAGFAACAMQIHPNQTNMQIFKTIERSASLYPYFDYKHGFGIPQARKVLYETEELHEFTFKFDLQEEALYLDLYPRRNDHPTPNLIYFHVLRDDTTLYYYAVVRAESNRVRLFDADGNLDNSYLPQEGDIVKVHYQGFSKSLTLKFQ
jgi:hypothetical protein